MEKVRRKVLEHKVNLVLKKEDGCITTEDCRIYGKLSLKKIKGEAAATGMLYIGYDLIESSMIMLECSVEEFANVARKTVLKEDMQDE